MIRHLDETGAPCGNHGAVPDEELLPLALVATRLSGFHHDLASKLQGLMMAIDEITELSEGGDPGLADATSGASQALREILDLLNNNRALTKPPVRMGISLADLAARAAERVRVGFVQPLPATMLEVGVPAMTQALALVLDVAGGAGGRSRTVEARVSEHPADVELRLALPRPTPEGAARAFGIAAGAFRREGGDLRCSADGAQVVVRLPRQV